MNTEPQILLYNFTGSDRHRMIQRYLRKSGVSIRKVEAPEFLHPLGYLFEIPGFSTDSRFNLGGNFQDEMMVMRGFSEEQTDRFLAFFREQNLEPVRLKAVLTPITEHWDSLKLYHELCREYKAMR